MGVQKVWGQTLSEEDSILKSKISSYVEKYMVLGKDQHNIQREKS